jgi:cytidylate kinase
MISVAIDGPAGAGKSTLSRRLAESLGYIYVDTGAMYRAVGLKLIRNGVDCSDETKVSKVLETTKVEIAYEDGAQIVLLDGENVNGLIRTPEVSMMASKCSALPVVRAFLLNMQRNLAKENNVVMDGRDIGTVVLPNAQVKIFLTASVEARSKRRYDELVLKGENVTLEEVTADVIKRDYNDTNREIAPLKPSETSVIVDTTEINFEDSLELLKKTVKNVLEGAK